MNQDTKLFGIMVLLAISFIVLFSVVQCSAEEDTSPPPSIVTTPKPEPEPPAPTQYSLTVTAGEGGTVSSNGGTYDEGTEVTITATPEEGYEFVGWEGSDSESNSLSITLNGNTTVQALFERSFFVSKSERYSAINETTGFYNNQKGFKRYLRTDDLIDYLYYEEDENSGENWVSFANVAITNDFDKDGYLDVYSFLYNFRNNEENYGVHEGKHLFIGDYFSSSEKNKIVINSEISHASTGVNISDFDLNGFDDILLFADNQAKNEYNEEEEMGGGVNVPMIEGEILFNQGENIFIPTKIGIKINTHDHGSVGDIDNDGDTDIIVGPIRNNEVRYPKLYRNDGTGQFSVEELFKSSLSDDFYLMRYFHFNLFDVNGDNYLDLIAGREIGEYDSVNSCCYEYQNTNPIIFWGDGTGKFDINNKTILETNYQDYFSKAIILGSGYTDFDQDGDIDVLITSTLNEPNSLLSGFGYYQSYILFLYENKGSNNFEDVTNLKFTGNKEIDRNQFIDFYDFAMFDFDDDGDYDLFPNAIGLLNPYGETPDYEGLFWENTGGQFVRREN